MEDCRLLRRSKARRPKLKNTNKKRGWIFLRAGQNQWPRVHRRLETRHWRYCRPEAKKCSRWAAATSIAIQRVRGRRDASKRRRSIRVKAGTEKNSAGTIRELNW